MAWRYLPVCCKFLPKALAFVEDIVIDLILQLPTGARPVGTWSLHSYPAFIDHSCSDQRLHWLLCQSHARHVDGADCLRSIRIVSHAHGNHKPALAILVHGLLRTGKRKSYTHNSSNTADTITKAPPRHMFQCLIHSGTPDHLGNLPTTHASPGRCCIQYLRPVGYIHWFDHHFCYFRFADSSYELRGQDKSSSVDDGLSCCILGLVCLDDRCSVCGCRRIEESGKDWSEEGLRRKGF